MTTDTSRRAVLASAASIGLFALPTGACSGARDLPGTDASQPAPPLNPVAGTAGMQVRIRSNERLEVDLSSVLAGFNDTGNLISVSVTGAVKARIWLMREMGSTDKPFGFVKRELLDYFTVQNPFGSDGATVGSITFTGYTGPNGSGRAVSETVSFICDNSPPKTWAMGVNTRGRFGGFPIHQYLPGNPQDWVLTTPAQFTLLKDPTPRTEQGSGRTYENGYSRVVLASPTYGGAPTIPPVAGQTVNVILNNTVLGQSHTVAITFVAGQCDCAAWPATDTVDARPEAPTTQLGMAMRWPVNFTFGNTFMLEEGDHNYGGLQPGFTTAFGVTKIAGAPPRGCFKDDSKFYSANPVFNPQLITWRGRTQGVYVGSMNIDLRSFDRSASPALGFRISRMQIANLGFYDGGGREQPYHHICVDHVEAINLEAPTASCNIGVGAWDGACIISNWIKGSLRFAGTDFQFIGNRIEPPVTTFDAPPCWRRSLSMFTNDALKLRMVVAALVGCRLVNSVASWFHIALVVVST